MASKALSEWQSVRTVRINRLIGMHVLVGGGPAVVSRRPMEELSHALVLRLASEFQGFCKDLHDDVAGALAGTVAPGDYPLQLAIADACTTGRRLDFGNANPDALKQDFGRFGFDVWEGLAAAFPVEAGNWRGSLEVLNQARNGIAHADTGKLLKLKRSGCPVDLGTVRRWRSALDGLTVGMDRVVGDYVGVLLNAASWGVGEEG